MNAGAFRLKFQQAAIGHDPDVLAHIGVPQFNLAVWRKAAEPLRHSAYMQSLDFNALGTNLDWEDNYYKVLLHQPIPLDPQARSKTVAAFDKALTSAGFPQQAASTGKLPRDTVDRRGLANTLYDLGRHFASAIEKSASMSLLIFRPDGHGFWHTDGGSARGIVTLRGDTATLWRPDSSLTGETCSRGIYWGDVNPDTQDFIQSINPGDLAVFKCRGHENPLVHATPLTTESRLIAIMGESNIPRVK